MNRFRALLLATILGLACTAIPTGALAQGTGHPHGKRAQARCAAKAKGKHHRKPGAKHTRKCTRRGKHAEQAHSTDGARKAGDKRSTDRNQSRPTPPSHQPASHQAASHQPASHQSSRRPQTGRSKRPGQTRETTVSAGPSAASTIANVLARTCENTELMPEAGNLEAVEQATLCLVNQERARNGELPLQTNSELAKAAEGHSQEMVGDDYFAHVSPSEETPLQRIEATGYIPNGQVGYTLGENIAWGTLYLATPKAIVAAWLASPEHLANILGAAYTETGLGVAPAAPASLAEGEPGAVYSQEFGVIEG